jgi:hypothetical protein
MFAGRGRPGSDVGCCEYLFAAIVESHLSALTNEKLLCSSESHRGRRALCGRLIRNRTIFAVRSLESEVREAYRVRARNARQRAMHAKHPTSMNKYEAVEPPTIAVYT